MIDKPLIELSRIKDYIAWAEEFKTIIRSEAFEEAAKICDQKSEDAAGWNMEDGGFEQAIYFCEDCATTIRKLK